MSKLGLVLLAATTFSVGGGVGFFYADNQAKKYILRMHSIDSMNNSMLSMKLHEMFKEDRNKEAIEFLEKWIDSQKTEAKSRLADGFENDNETFFHETIEYIEKYESGVRYEDL